MSQGCSGTADEWRALARDRPHHACEARGILELVGDKWSLLVISLLADRTVRFTELRREIDGISQRMLARTLRQLERTGLVTRTVHPVVPPRVDYELTKLGATLLETAQELILWAVENRAEIGTAKSDYDARQAAEQAVSAGN